MKNLLEMKMWPVKQKKVRQQDKHQMHMHNLFKNDQRDFCFEIIHFKHSIKILFLTIPFLNLKCRKAEKVNILRNKFPSIMNCYQLYEIVDFQNLPYSLSRSFLFGRHYKTQIYHQIAFLYLHHVYGIGYMLKHTCPNPLPSHASLSLLYEIVLSHPWELLCAHLYLHSLFPRNSHSCSPASEKKASS